MPFNPTQRRPMPITFSIVEDDRETREYLVALLAGQDTLRCLSAYPTGEKAIVGIPGEKPEVAIVDINLPGMNGIECVAQLKAVLPEMQVLMLTTYEDTDMIFESLRAGASGYLLKKRLSVDLVQAIEQVHAGGSPMSSEIARKVVEYFRRPPAAKSGDDVDQLTSRETELLALLAEGCLYKEIGERLGVSYNTVRAHVRNVYKKLHVQSRAHATLKYLNRGTARPQG
jgi:DNA-binding NarL/FixJ family response regulator